MIILGLHFGHDAAVSVLHDGVVVNCIVRERLSRTKHALALDARTVMTALDDAGLSPSDVDLCALTSTQTIELVSLTPAELTVITDLHPRHLAPSVITRVVGRRGGRWQEELLTQGFLDWIYAPPPHGVDPDRHLHQRTRAYFPEYAARPRSSLAACGAFDNPIVPNSWSDAVGLATLAERDAGMTLAQHGFRFGMHVPVTVRLFGHELAGYIVNHHLAHAASAFYPSGLDEAAILTHDGWPSLHATNPGLCWYGRGARLYPLAPHFLSVGSLYQLTGSLLGLGAVGQEGKLMGLAPYGRPAFHDARYVGNLPDTQAQGVRDYLHGWFDHCRSRAAAMGYDIGGLADPARVTEPVNADIAASTQAIFEETMLRAVQGLLRMTERNGLATRGLCLVGGTALNCPANTRIWRESGFESVFVPPWTDDSGLALGAALALYHAILERPRRTADGAPSPYLGQTVSAGAIDHALASAGDLEIVPTPDAAGAAAREIACGGVVAWYEERSEVGPRALGHRSILADPRRKENWARVNRIKAREVWRPLAPAVLTEKAAAWFDSCPLPSPYMLFTGRVKGDRLPAVTHVDGSARPQTVDASCGRFRALLQAFDALTGCPVLLNTSLNGPGEPIVEVPREALAFLRASELDALYIGGRRVSRRRPPSD